MNVTLQPGWADKLRPGSQVIVQVPTTGRRPSDSYHFAVVDSVTTTQVRVEGVAYRRGKGRSQYVEYGNEGIEVDGLTEEEYARIWPVTAATRNALDALRSADNQATHAAKLARTVAAAARAAAADGNSAALEAAAKVLT